MKNKVIAERYAESLFEIAREQRLEAKFDGMLRDIIEMSKQHPQFKEILDHPVIRKQDKKQMLSQLFEGKIPKELFAFLSLLVDKKRENYLGEISAAYKRLLDAHNQVVLTEVYTAIPLEKDNQSFLKKTLESYLGQSVEMRCHTDPELLGGVTVKIGDRMIDGSLRTQLNQLTQTLVSKS